MSDTNIFDTNSFGLAHFLPVHIQEELECSKMFFNNTPWGSVSIMGLRGVVKSSGINKVIINHEWPIPLLYLEKDLSKKEVENLHLQRFITDYFLVTGKIEYSNIIPGDENNPPDFFCNFNEKSISIDCVQFTIRNRRTVNALFGKIKSKILNVHRNYFSHLRGYIIYTWFDNNSYPHKAQDKNAIEQIIEMLKTVKSNPKQLLIPWGELPEQAPDIGAVKTEKGCGFYPIPMLRGYPVTRFFNLTGFEMALSYTSAHSQEEGWIELRRLIQDHDKKEIKHLLITVGGPSKDGLVFLADETLTYFMLEDSIPKLETAYLETIILHIWTKGTIIKLFPEYEVITWGLFPNGLNLAFNSI